MDWSTWALVWFYAAGLVPAFLASAVMLDFGTQPNLRHKLALVGMTMLWPATAIVMTILFLGDIVLEAIQDAWDSFVDMLNDARP